jgi:hypothetical protein
MERMEHEADHDELLTMLISMMSLVEAELCLGAVAVKEDLRL